MLPRLGLPDPAGEWHTVKAAIGKKADVVDLVVNPSIQTPLHPEVPFNDTAVVGVEFQGAFWVLFLLKPKSFSPTAPPEFFTVKLKRGPAAGRLPISASLKDDIDWIFWPMSAFEEQMNAVASPASAAKMVLRPLYGCGRAADVKRWQDYESRARRDVSKQEARERDIIDADWDVALHGETVLTAVSQGDESLSSGRELVTLIRIHPAPDGDFRSIDYVVHCRSEAVASISEHRWKPLPPQATRPDGDRKFVNLYRAAAGKKRFNKEEWIEVRAAEQQTQQGSSRLRARIFDQWAS